MFRPRIHEPEPRCWHVALVLVAIVVMVPFAMISHIAASCCRGYRWIVLKAGEPIEVPREYALTVSAVAAAAVTVMVAAQLLVEAHNAQALECLVYDPVSHGAVCGEYN